MTQKLYDDLAPWWPLLSSPADYKEEAAFYLRTMRDAARRPVRTCLELGAGGGNNALHMKSALQLTLTDPADGMLAHSRVLNPECEHLIGDMRALRLGRSFDAVFVHDAVCYMTTRDELRAAIATARAHCAEGGVVLFCPDAITELFEPGTECGGEDAPDGRALRYLEWCWDPDPQDEQYTVDYTCVMRGTDGRVRVEHDRHVEGLFPRDVWLGLLADAGFTARAIPFTHSEVAPGRHEIFVGVL